MDTTSILIRFCLVFFAAFLFGLDRQRRSKPIGFGTFIFVATGSSALGITALLLSPENPLPLLGAIVTGIGFLGAGALIKTGDRIAGFTTASMIWLFAIFGLLVGVGEYILGLMIYATLVIVRVVDYKLEMLGIGAYKRTLLIVMQQGNEKELARELVAHKTQFKLLSMKEDKKEKSSERQYVIKGSNPESLAQALLKKPWCKSVSIH